MGAENTPPPDQNQNRTQGRSAPTLSTFTVELADQKCSGTIPINTLRLRDGMRGAWSKINVFAHARDLGEMNNMPDIPGIRLTVDPRKRTVTIHDPLSDDAKLCAQIKKVQQGSDDYPTIRNVGSEEWQPTPTVTHPLDADELKSLLIEIAQAVYAKPDVSTMVAMPGSHVPTLKELEDFPGDEIYDPWNSSTDKPRLKKDVPAWRRRIEAQSV